MQLSTKLFKTGSISERFSFRSPGIDFFPRAGWPTLPIESLPDLIVCLLGRDYTPFPPRAARITFVEIKSFAGFERYAVSGASLVLNDVNLVGTMWHNFRAGILSLTTSSFAGVWRDEFVTAGLPVPWFSTVRTAALSRVQFSSMPPDCFSYLRARGNHP
jgi:hypothetical protein